MRRYFRADPKVHPAPKHKPVVLVADGKPQARIYLTEACGRKCAGAVRELTKCIQQSSGAALKTVKKLPADQTVIIVGDCPEAAAAGLDGAKMPIEGFQIKTAANRVYIVGNGDVGTAWGVLDFAERFIGARFYWPGADGMSVLKSKTISIAPAHISDQPVFRKRQIWPSGGRRVTRDVGPHHARMRSHSSWPIELIVHAPHDWHSKYDKTRPEIFQLQGDGKRNTAMLCYGNPKTLQTYLEEIELQRKSPPKNRRAGIIRGKSISVSPADMAVSCKCEHCRKLWNDKGGSYGTASRVMAAFVKNLAVEVKKRWPDMTVIFLPYKNYTYAPEGIEFPGNVEVQICGMPGLAQHKDPVIRKAEQDNIDAWVKASGRKIQNWHYNCWPADRTKAAYHYAHTIKQHYIDNRDKTVGTFINGVKDHWPRQNFSLYVWMKVLWNPAFDVDAAFDAYCKRMFGPAQKTMRQLITMQMDGWEKREWSTHRFSPKSVYEESFPREDVKKMAKLLDQAFADAKDDELVTRRLNYLAPPLKAFFQESKQIVDGTGIKTLNSYQVAENPKLDGKLGDACWKDVPGVVLGIANKPEVKAKFPTELKSVWTRQGITFAFKLMEPEIDKLAAKFGQDSRDGSTIWWDDNVELFLDPAGERTDYYQFIINSKGALFDSHAKDFSWSCKGIKVATHVGKDHWTIEVYIPYSAFKKSLPPGTASTWYGNFTRHRVTDRKSREYQRLNSTGSPSSSDQNAFGPIKFIER